MKHDKKNEYAPSGMRPLSAFSRQEAPAPKAAPAASMNASPTPQVQSTVSTLTGQNKVSGSVTAQQTPIRVAEQQQLAEEAAKIKAAQEAAAQEMAAKVAAIEAAAEQAKAAVTEQPPVKEAASAAPVSAPAPEAPKPTYTSITDTIPVQSQPKYRSITENMTAITNPAVQDAAIRSNPAEKKKPNVQSQPSNDTSKRIAHAPDLSVKAEREEFFSRFFTPDNVSADQVSEAIKRQEARRAAQRKILENQQNARNAAENAPQRPAYDKMQTGTLYAAEDYWNKPTDRPVISHAKDDSEIFQKIAEEQPEQISLEMSENIENAVSAKRKASNEKIMSKRLKRSESLGAAIQTFAIGALLLVCGLYLVLGTHAAPAGQDPKKPVVFPEFSMHALISGSYAADLAAYFNGTIPKHDSFAAAGEALLHLKGFSSAEDAQVTEEIDTEESSDIESEPATEETLPEATEAESENTDETAEVTINSAGEDEQAIEVGDNIIIYQNRAMSYFGGGYEVGERYAKAVNSVQSQLDINVYSMVVPTAVSYYLSDAYAAYTADEEDNIAHIDQHLKNVTPIDVYHVLEQHKDEDIYARTDHHWLPLGAYYAAEEFAKTVGVSFTDITKMKSASYDDYVGSMYLYTSSNILLENPETFTYYIPPTRYKTEYYDSSFQFDYEGALLQDIAAYDPGSYYLVFMGGDSEIAHVSTDVDNRRTLVVFKDSFGNALIPYLTGSFSNIYVCDIRNFDLNAVDFCRQVGATDLLFAMNTFSATGENEGELERVINA